MKCKKCGSEIKIAMAAKIKSEGVIILTSVTTIVTAQCKKCGAKFQTPIQSNSIISQIDK